MIRIEFDTETAAFYDYPEDEIRLTLDQAARFILHEPMGPSGFVKALRDTNGNTIGKVTVTP